MVLRYRANHAIGLVGRTVLIILTACVFLSSSSFAATGASFLREDLAARPMGLAGSFVAIAEGSEGALWNPAGLAFQQTMEVSTSYLKNLDDASQFFLGWVTKVGNGGVGISIRASQAGTADIFDSTGSLRTVRAEDDYIISSSYAFPLIGGLGIGMTGKWIRSTIAEQATAAAWAGDVGLLWCSSPRRSSNEEGLARRGLSEGGWSVGVSFQNMGQDLTYISTGDWLPVVGRIGVAYHAIFVPHDYTLLMTVEMNKVVNDSTLPWHTGVGVEVGFLNLAALRAGYQSSPSGEIKAFGGGVKWDQWRLDVGYSLQPGDVGKSYISISWLGPKGGTP